MTERIRRVISGAEDKANGVKTRICSFVKEQTGNRKKLIRFSSVSLLVLTITIFAIVKCINVLIDRSSNLINGVELYISPETEFSTVSEAILPNLKWKNSFMRKAAKEELDKKMKYGYYRFNKGLSTNYIARALKYGWESPVRIVIPENIRSKGDLCKKLGRYVMADSAQFSAVIENYTHFIPNTYEIYWSMSAEKIVERFEKEWKIFWESKPAFAKERQDASLTREEIAMKIGLSPVEVTIIASIVCKESNHIPEYHRIAGVYVHRLKIGMPLQADPTVVFAVGDYTIKRVTGQHLKVNSPYNTYKYRGLPPGPICLPSIAAIDAVLNYEKEQYLYFCANSNFDGTHIFAKTLAEHSRNGAAYRKALRKMEKK